MQGNKNYLHLLDFLKYLHIVKAWGYGSDEDPLDNLRAAKREGIAPWRGAYLRHEDKANRIRNLTARGDIPSHGEREGILDTMADRMAYDGLTAVLYAEDELQMTDTEFAAAFPIKALPGEDLLFASEVQFDAAWLELSVNEVEQYLRQWYDAHVGRFEVGSPEREFMARVYRALYPVVEPAGLMPVPDGPAAEID